MTVPSPDSTSCLNNLEALTLFVDDIALAKEFYFGTFAGTVVYEDDTSIALRLGGVVLNLLLEAEAAELVEPRPIGSQYPSVSSVLTVLVESVDEACARLERQGLTFLNGPINRPWGRRTAAFTDPFGHIWEVAQILDPE